MQNKIILSILVAFSISIFTILLINLVYPEPDTVAGQDHKFYFKKFDPKKEHVFLIGSSHMGQLNTTLVNEIVSKSNSSFEVYNLAISGDMPSKRLQHVERTIALKPKLIIYGISFRDFELDKKENHFPLPEPKKIIRDILPKSIEQHAFNPLITTLKVIRDVFKNSEDFTEHSKIRLENNAFYYIDPKLHHTTIENIEGLKKQSTIMKKDVFSIDISSTSLEIKSLKDIINAFKKNNIAVVLYETPLHQYYLDSISNSDKENFNLIINQIAHEADIHVYDFTYKYSNDMIWGDLSHVVYNKNATIYSEDVAKIILGEIEP